MSFLPSSSSAGPPGSGFSLGLQSAAQSYRQYLSGGLAAVELLPGIYGSDRSGLRSTVASLRRAASCGLAVLLLGERGVGKSLFARLVHEFSGRRGEFVECNCSDFGSASGLALSALSGIAPNSGLSNCPRGGARGLFAAAHNGTLFLDEVGEMPRPVQASMLTVLDNGHYRAAGGGPLLSADVLFILATNESPRFLLEQGRWAAPFYDRISMVQISIPPLRERREDIPALIHYFSKLNGDRVRFAQDCYFALLAYDWPQNIRGLALFLRAVHHLAKPGIVKLDDLRKLPIDPALVTSLHEAYAAYVSARGVQALQDSQERILTALVARAASTLGELFKPPQDPIPLATLKAVITDGLSNLRTDLEALGFPGLALAAASNALAMLKACQLDQRAARRLAHQAYLKLGEKQVQLSSRYEPEQRYLAFESFFGLSFDQLRYLPR